MTILSKWKRINRKLYRAFKGLVAPKERNSIRSLFHLFQAAAVAVIVVFLVNLIPSDNKGFGEWGDFFGGVLNPLLTFLTFMGLLITIIIQQTELRESRVELRKSADALREQSIYQRRQNFESTYFQMVRTHQELVGTIDLVNSSGVETSGRDCFRIFYTRLNKEYRKNKDKSAGNHSENDILSRSFKIFWKEHQLELGHYFRYLTSVLSFIEMESEAEGLYLDNIEALLSDQELLLIFYFASCEETYGGKLKGFLETRGLLRNTPIIRLLDQSHRDLIDASAFSMRYEE